MAEFRTILYLDDVRVPTGPGVKLVRSFQEFVEYLRERGMPDLISFDHDLAPEHYPLGTNKAGEKIPYRMYRQETGLHCARFITQNKLPLRQWAVHSSNVQGRINIERELRSYRRRGEVHGLKIPFDVPPPVEEIEIAEERVVATQGRYSSTSLLQFEEEIPLESWERGRVRKFARI